MGEREVQRPKVSVVVPAYQSAETIAACVESVVRQTELSWELIVVDDGSTDGTAAIVDRLAGTEPRMTVVHQPNKGRSEARWVGVAQAVGTWVTFVDSDDTLPADAMDWLLAAAADATDIVLGNGHTLGMERRKLIPMADFRHLAVRAEGVIGVPWGNLYRRTLLTRYAFDLPRDIVNGEDYIFWLRLVFATDKPVSVVYREVYRKGDDHTCSQFVWTTDYCYRLNEYRVKAVPADVRQAFLSDMLDDRIANLFAVAVSQPRSQWHRSAFYADIVADQKALRRHFTLRQRLFLLLPARWLRRWASSIH